MKIKSSSTTKKKELSFGRQVHNQLQIDADHMWPLMVTENYQKHGLAP